jgi:hypothetical protein
MIYIGFFMELYAYAMSCIVPDYRIFTSLYVL